MLLRYEKTESARLSNALTVEVPDSRPRTYRRQPEECRQPGGDAAILRVARDSPEAFGALPK